MSRRSTVINRIDEDAILTQLRESNSALTITACQQHWRRPGEAMLKLNSAAAMSLAVAGLFTAVPASAQTYPLKPVRIITGGAGTFHDIVTRQLGQRLTERWSQAVVVENQGAAALTIGTGMAARATPDGYTLVMSDRSALAVAPNLYKSIPYDPIR